MLFCRGGEKGNLTGQHLEAEFGGIMACMTSNTHPLELNTIASSKRGIFAGKTMLEAVASKGRSSTQTRNGGASSAPAE